MPSKSTRSWLYVAGAAVACAGVLIAGNLAFARSRTPDVVIPGAAPVAVASSAAPAPSRTPGSGEEQDNTPIGPVADTGIKAAQGTWALYLIALSDKAVPGTHFGVMLGRRLPGGKLTADVVTNETTGSDTAPGFHAGEGSMVLDGGRSLVFGYYAGPVAKVTGKAHGKTVTAHLAASGKDGVQIYWFGGGVTTVSGLKAVDAHGRALPAGNPELGVG
jgi:hypothetical protein